MSTCKVYVEVTAKFSKDGRLLPLSVRWQDGHVYEIQRITDICRAASLKAGGAGDPLYLCDRWQAEPFVL